MEKSMMGGTLDTLETTQMKWGWLEGLEEITNKRDKGGKCAAAHPFEFTARVWSLCKGCGRSFGTPRPSAASLPSDTSQPSHWPLIESRLCARLPTQAALMQKKFGKNSGNQKNSGLNLNCCLTNQAICDIIIITKTPIAATTGEKP